MNSFDWRYRSLILTKIFTKGWGNPQDLKRLFEFRKLISNRETCQHLVKPDYPIHIDKEETQKHVKVLEGHFVSPSLQHLEGIMPEEVKIARFQMILPTDWKKHGNILGKDLKPMCIQLGGTGDHGFRNRRIFQARPLLKQAGIGSIILENPYYGCRKPKQQFRSSLQNVSDLFVMGGSLVLESLALLHWCERNGYGPLGITGISMGGHMASLAASNWPKPLSLIPCLSWSTASQVFTEGVLSSAIDWKLLEDQYFQDRVYREELAEAMHSPELNRRKKDYQFGFKSAADAIQTTEDSLLDPTPLKTKDTLVENKNNTSSQFFKFFNWLKFSRDKTSNIDENIKDFMCGVMDECTHLGNFSVPVDPRLIIIVIASKDGYIPRDTVMSLKDMWPGAVVRKVDTGHVGAISTKQGEFRQAIIDSFSLQVQKYS